MSQRWPALEAVLTLSTLSLGMPLSGGVSNTHLALNFVWKAWLQRPLVDPESLFRSNLQSPECVRCKPTLCLFVITKWRPSGQTACQAHHLIRAGVQLSSIHGKSCNAGDRHSNRPWLLQLEVPRRVIYFTLSPSGDIYNIPTHGQKPLSDG